MRCLFLSLLLLISIAQAAGQNERIAATCVKDLNAPPASAYYWPPDAQVKVSFIRNMFTPAQQLTLLRAMAEWTNAAAEIGSGVNFRYAGETNELKVCASCLTVTRRDVYKDDGKHYAFFNPLQQDSAGLLVSAWIDFDFATTDPQALQGFMAHELGHGMGLWDCKSCKKKQTIMNSFPAINKDNGLVAPSTCDLAVVKKIYQLERQVARNTVSETAQRASRLSKQGAHKTNSSTPPRLKR